MSNFAPNCEGLGSTYHADQTGWYQVLYQIFLGLAASPACSRVGWGPAGKRHWLYAQSDAAPHSEDLSVLYGIGE